MTAEATHVVHWVPPELIRTRKRFGRKAGWGYWELQPLDAWESGRCTTEGADFTVLDDPDSCPGGDVMVRELTAAVAAALGCPVTLEEDKAANGKGVCVIPGWHHKPVRWIDAPVYTVRPAGGDR